MKKKIFNIKLLTGILTVTAIFGTFPNNVFADSEKQTDSYTASTTVVPDEDDDFDSYSMDVIFTIHENELTNINLSSEWGRKASKNKTYSSNALYGIAESIKGSSYDSLTIDSVSGATCSSKAIEKAIREASDAHVWSSVSQSLTASVNGEAINGSSSDDDDDHDNSGSEEKPDNDSGEKPDNGSSEKPNNGSGGGKPGKEDNSLTLPEGTAASYQNISAKDGIIKVHFELPEGYTSQSINLIRVGNTAMMPARDPESFNRIFTFDADNSILTINQAELDGASKLTVSLKFTDGKQTGTTDIAVVVLSESSITLSDKTAEYTGKAISADAAAVIGSTGSITYTYYSDSACTFPLNGLPTAPGTYYVVASVAEDHAYYGAESLPAKLVITPAAESETADPAESDKTDKTDKNDKTQTDESETKESESSKKEDVQKDNTKKEDTKKETAVPGSNTSNGNSGSTGSSQSSNSSGSVKSTATPKTGDAAQPFLMGSIALLSALVIIVGGFKLKKNKLK